MEFETGLHHGSKTEHPNDDTIVTWRKIRYPVEAKVARFGSEYRIGLDICYFHLGPNQHPSERVGHPARDGCCGTGERQTIQAEEGNEEFGPPRNHTCPLQVVVIGVCR